MAWGRFRARFAIRRPIRQPYAGEVTVLFVLTAEEVTLPDLGASESLVRRLYAEQAPGPGSWEAGSPLLAVFTWSGTALLMVRSPATEKRSFMLKFSTTFNIFSAWVLSLTSSCFFTWIA